MKAAVILGTTVTRGALRCILPPFLRCHRHHVDILQARFYVDAVESTACDGCDCCRLARCLQCQPARPTTLAARGARYLRLPRCSAPRRLHERAVRLEPARRRRVVQRKLRHRRLEEELLAEALPKDAGRARRRGAEADSRHADSPEPARRPGQQRSDRARRAVPRGRPFDHARADRVVARQRQRRAVPHRASATSRTICTSSKAAQKISPIMQSAIRRAQANAYPRHGNAGRRRARAQRSSVDHRHGGERRHEPHHGLRPQRKSWAQHRNTATIHWVTAQWQFPCAVVNPPGGRQLLTTTVTRSTDGSPIAGWVVRYEVGGGPAAGFGPQLDPAVEVPTDAIGQATVELNQRAAANGTNQINVSVIRPADPGTGIQSRIVLGSGVTTATWGTGSVPVTPPSSVPAAGGNQPPAATSGVTIRATGPAQATVGGSAEYRFRSPTRPARRSAASRRAPRFPPHWRCKAAIHRPAFPARRRRGTSARSASAKRERSSSMLSRGKRERCSFAHVLVAGRVAARGCATTTIAGDQPFDINVRTDTVATQYRVGDQVTFVISVANRGAVAMTGIELATRRRRLAAHRTGPPRAKTSLVGRIDRKRVARDSPHVPDHPPAGFATPSWPRRLKATPQCANRASTRLATPAAAVSGARCPRFRSADDQRRSEGDVPGRSDEQRRDAAGEPDGNGRFRADQPRVSNLMGFANANNRAAWRIARLEPRQTLRRGIEFTARGPNPASFVAIVVNEGDRSVGGAGANVAVIAAAPAAQGGQLKLEVTDTGDPIGAGDKLSVFISLQNTGGARSRTWCSKCCCPQGDAAPRAIAAQVRATGRTIRFDLIGTMRPLATETFIVLCTTERPWLIRAASHGSQPHVAATADATSGHDGQSERPVQLALVEATSAIKIFPDDLQNGNRSSSFAADSSTRNGASRSTSRSIMRRALFGRGGVRIAGAGVGGQQVPGPRDRDPAAVDGLEPRLRPSCRRRRSACRRRSCADQVRESRPGRTRFPFRRRGRRDRSKISGSTSPSTRVPVAQESVAVVLPYSSRSSGFRSLPPWLLSSTILRMP